jgi:hypothetical protein
VKYILTYESPADLDMEVVLAHVDAHRARWTE